MRLEIRNNDILYIAISNLKTHKRKFEKVSFISLWNNLKEKYGFTLRPEDTMELEDYLNSIDIYKLYVVYFSREEAEKFVKGVSDEDRRRAKRDR